MINSKEIDKILKKRPLPNQLWYGEPNFGSYYTSEEINSLTKLIKNSNSWHKGFGPRPVEIEIFERNFSKYCKVKNSIAVSNNGDGFDMFLKVLKLKKTDEVITTSLNFKAWLMVMSRHNLKIKFCDINIFDLNMNVDDLEKKITRNTRLICPVHMGGISCKVDEIKEIVDYYSKKFGKKIYTIYDSARATGIHYKGKPVGGFGDGEIFSFHGAKLLSTLGEGGMITTNNSNIAKKLREMTSYGGEHSWGMNYRMTKIGAFIGNLQLKRLNKMNEKRIKIARDRISFLEGNEKIILPEINKKLENVFYLFPIILKNKFSRSDRDLVLKILEKDYKIICSIPKNINKRWSFVKKHYGIPKLKNTDFVYDRIFCPIMHPKLNSKQNIFLSAAILKSLRGI